jgi:Domain of unknown function (DUF6378)
MTNTIRGQVLNEAQALTEGDRNQSYGDPKVNLQHHADLFTTYCRIRGLLAPDKAFTASDMAEALNLGKIARRAFNQGHRDSYVDGCAYTAIAYECAEKAIETKAIRPFKGQRDVSGRLEYDGSVWRYVPDTEAMIHQHNKKDVRNELMQAFDTIIDVGGVKPNPDLVNRLLGTDSLATPEDDEEAFEIYFDVLAYDEGKEQYWELVVVGTDPEDRMAHHTIICDEKIPDCLWYTKKLLLAALEKEAESTIKVTPNQFRPGEGSCLHYEDYQVHIAYTLPDHLSQSLDEALNLIKQAVADGGKVVRQSTY